MNLERLRFARDRMPPRLNAGILQGDGGFCILGWLLFCAGFHPIKMYSFTIGVVDPARGGSAIDVVAREYGLTREEVVELARLNDGTASERRRERVLEKLDAILGSAA